MKEPEPYRVELCGVGCPTCSNGEQFDIIGPDGSAQSQSWGDREEAEYICELLNLAHQFGRVSYAQETLDRLTREVQEGKSYAAPKEKAPEQQEVAATPPASPEEDDIPF